MIFDFFFSIEVDFNIEKKKRKIYSCFQTVVLCKSSPRKDLEPVDIDFLGFFLFFHKEGKKKF